MQNQFAAAEGLAGLTPSKVLLKPLAAAVNTTLKVGWATTLGGIPLGLTKVVYNGSSALAPYNIAPAESTLGGEKGIGTVTLKGPFASITGFWQAPSLKGPTLTALIGQKGNPSPSVFLSTTKEGKRVNAIATSDSGQAFQMGLGMTVGTPNLNAQWLGQFRLLTIGDSVRYVSNSSHPKARYGNNHQVEIVSTAGSGMKIPGIGITLPSVAVLSTGTKVSVGEIGFTTIKEAAPRRLLSVTGQPLAAKPLHNAAYAGDDGTFGYLSKYSGIVEPNYALREEQRLSKLTGYVATPDPFSWLQAPTRVLKENTFDATLGNAGKFIVAPVTGFVADRIIDGKAAIFGPEKKPAKPEPPVLTKRSDSPPR
jgi:hypothetical protein